MRPTEGSVAKQKSGRPFLRWAGSKRAMLPSLRALVPSFAGKYIEPFAGSACLFFDINPREAVLGDLNERLIATYQTVARDPIGVAHVLSKLPVGSEAYYLIRKEYGLETGDLDQAATFIYLNRFCFNGLYRTNLKGMFNVPYGAPRSGAVPTGDDLQLASTSIRNAQLIAGDFEAIVRNHARKDDFIYLDPPFHISRTRVFRQYTATPFTLDDFGRLTALLNDLDLMGAKFLVSYAYSEDAETVFEKYNTCRVATRRNISGFPQFRASAQELLVANYTI